MKKVLWFSGFEMTAEQVADLQKAYGEVEIHQVNKRISHVSEIADNVAACDVACVVAPLELQAEFLEVLGDRPLLVAENGRVFNADGSKVAFSFRGWSVVSEIRNRHHPLSKADGRDFGRTGVLWFSRHDMGPKALQDLREVFGRVDVKQMSRTISSTAEVWDDILDCDVCCAVLPPALQEAFMNVLTDKPFLRPVTVAVKQEDGSVRRAFDHWDVVDEYSVKKKPLLQ